MRDMLFVSHANPEDNSFALWLSLSLAREGYPVWCDLTRLLGGEAFWGDIERAIRERTVKFLYVLSRTSNAKPGPRDELQLARTVQRQEGLRDFIIPLTIDDLQSREFNINLQNINAVAFCGGWARGLAQLLKKLEEDSVGKNPNFSPAAVAGWWRQNYNAEHCLRRKPERLISNWFPLRNPPVVYVHELHKRNGGEVNFPDELPYPAVRHKRYLISLAAAESFDGYLGPATVVSGTESHVAHPNHGYPAITQWTAGQDRHFLTQLLRQAWNRMLIRRSLSTYVFANKSMAFYFKTGRLPKDRVTPTEAAESASGRYRNIVGFKTLKGADGIPNGLRYWHFALEARPVLSPMLGYEMKPHVLFSDDGSTIWSSKDQLQRARRSQCKQWWNAEWRDRILFTVKWLAEGSEAIRLEVGPQATVEVMTEPLRLTCPVSYDETDLPTREETGDEEAEDMEADSTEPEEDEDGETVARETD